MIRVNSNEIQFKSFNENKYFKLIGLLVIIVIVLIFMVVIR